MQASWDVLCAAGVPDGAPRPAPSGALDTKAVTSALRALAGSDLTVTQRECLGAWLGAFRRHWPDAFVATLGPAGEALLARCLESVDANRYLKLRRIATANLSQML